MINLILVQNANAIFDYFLNILNVDDCSWIERRIQAEKESTCQRTRSATPILRPPLESSPLGELRFAWSIFDKFIFNLFFKITFKIMRKQT